MLQKRTAQAIVNIFETGSAAGDYGNFTAVDGDTRHLMYGRSQTTQAIYRSIARDLSLDESGT